MMRFQPRDEAILREVEINGGVLARRQLKNYFWPKASWRAMERRLQKLCEAGYLMRPTHQQRKVHPIPEPIVWLGWKGALYLAGLEGISLPDIKSENESHLRGLQRNLSKQGFHWVQEPPWNKLTHDLDVGDVRFSLMRSLSLHPEIILTHWWGEITFRNTLDVVQYRLGNSSVGPLLKKGVCPDAAFELTDSSKLFHGKLARARFLLEMDLGTEDIGRFGREKAAPGAAYIRSLVFRERFGSNHAFWLVVTARGEKRLHNLIQQTAKEAGVDQALFYFALLDQVRNQDILTAFIWWQGGKNRACTLIRPG